MSKELETLKNEIKNLDGKVFLGFVHTQVYGPVRNLNFVLESPSPEYLDKYLSEPQKEEEPLVTEIVFPVLLSRTWAMMPPSPIC